MKNCFLLVLSCVPFVSFSMDRSQELLDAVKQRGAPQRLQQLLAQGLNVNAVNDPIQRYTALHYAAQRNNIEYMKILLEAGAAIDAMVENRKTPLHYASEYGYPDSVKFLLQAGANPLLKDERGATARDYARTPEIAKILQDAMNARVTQVKNESNRNSNSNPSVTPAMPSSATIYNDPVSSSVSLPSGNNQGAASVTDNSNSNSTAPVKLESSEQQQVFSIIKENNLDKLKELAARVAIPQIDEQGNNQLHYAVSISNVDPNIVDFIIGLNPELATMRNKAGALPVELVPDNREDLVELFLPFLDFK
ncbi:ankyrin repeat domain-containing protein [Candidatus Dependentiae bacterium]|nr:ankyrin repeat domain-containing protein [Candidatus Dependentiae bacterium]